MSVTTTISQTFNRISSGAKRAAENWPVFIASRGEPARVLLSIAEYSRLSGRKTSINELLSDPAVAELDFDPPRMELKLRPADSPDVRVGYERRFRAAPCGKWPRGQERRGLGCAPGNKSAVSVGHFRFGT